MSGPSSQSSPSQRRPSTIPCTISEDDRSASVSSIRRTNTPPCRRAKSQLKRAVRAPPTCRYPVGEGAKRTRGVMEWGATGNDGEGIPLVTNLDVKGHLEAASSYTKD